MKKIQIVLLLLSLVIITSGCGKKADKGLPPGIGANDSAVANNSNKADDPDKEEVFSTTPEEMMKLGKSFKCTYTYLDQNKKTQTGDFYVDGKSGKFRTESEYLDIQSGKKIKTYMIADGKDLYSWDTDGVNPGMKTSMGTTTSDNKQTDADKQAELDAKATYKCRSWVADKTKFELPAGIKFMTFEELTNSYKTPKVK